MQPAFTAYDPDDPQPPHVACAGQTWVWQPDLAVQLNTGESTAVTFGNYSNEGDDTYGTLGIAWSASGPNVEVRGCALTCNANAG